MSSDHDEQDGDGSPARSQDLAFDPVANRVDFLDSAITYLKSSEDPRNLKYAVLHLQAAIEILVKVRLQREGFEHIFEDPYSADESKLSQGNFRSVTMDDALKRLARVADLHLAKSEVDALKFLNRERNKLQHFGSTSNHEVVNTRAAAALDVLSKFILEHLGPDAPEIEAGPFEQAEDLIHDALKTIVALNQARLARIAPELDRWPGIVIHCPACLQIAWTFEPHDATSRCRFCGRDWSQEHGQEAAEDYVSEVLNESRHDAAQGMGGWSVSECPECGFEALVDVATRADPTSFLTTACFHCGFRTTGQLGCCGRCGRTTPEPDDVICSHCMRDLASKD
nr:hypothetical protein [Kibdelosporangium sp. MJ126-NF4]CEL13505.1 hypothetical protein [Kibdelosporangium sp. MJ126-NF4]CTQ99190.1 hypothetical protein [Kibdelosporangium sp. MJ126-NF4]